MATSSNRAPLAPNNNNMPASVVKAGQPLKARVDPAAFADSPRSRPISPAPSVGGRNSASSTSKRVKDSSPGNATIRSPLTPGTAASNARQQTSPIPATGSFVVGNGSRARTKSTASLLPAATISTQTPSSSRTGPSVTTGAQSSHQTSELSRPRVRTKSLTSPAGCLPTTASVGAGITAKVRQQSRPASPARRPPSPARLPPVPSLPSQYNGALRSISPAASLSPKTPIIQRANTTPQERNLLSASLSSVNAKHIFASSTPSPDNTSTPRAYTPHSTPTVHTANGKDRPAPIQTRAKVSQGVPPHSPSLSLSPQPTSQMYDLQSSFQFEQQHTKSAMSPSPRMESEARPGRFVSSPTPSATMHLSHNRNNSASSASNTSAARHRSNSKTSSVNSVKDESCFENVREAERAREREREARERRKILDLEITNASLLAINATLERTKLKQGTELRELRKRIREGGSSQLAFQTDSFQGNSITIDDADDGDKPWSQLLEEDPQFKEVARCLESLVAKGSAALAVSRDSDTVYKGGTRVIVPSTFDDLSSSAASPLTSTASARSTASSVASHSRLEASTASSVLSTSQASDFTFDLGASHSTQSSEAEAWTSGIVSPLSSRSAFIDKQSISPSPRMYGIATNQVRHVL